MDDEKVYASGPNAALLELYDPLWFHWHLGKGVGW